MTWSRSKPRAKNFIEEARILAECQHAGIVSVIDFAEDNGAAYIVMLYYEGESFDAHLASRGGRLPWSEATGIMLAVLDGLESIHAAGLIHRDIKPQNIYLARDARGATRPILLDFGAARRTAGSHKLTIVLSERVRAARAVQRGLRTGTVDRRVCRGRDALLGDHGSPPPPAIKRLEMQTLTPAHVLAPGVPAKLSVALAQGLAMDVVQRPGSAKAFADLLRSAGPARLRPGVAIWIGTEDGGAACGPAGRRDPAHAGPVRAAPQHRPRRC